jgi:DNA-directed RNA polymerase, mitochondrial
LRSSHILKQLGILDTVAGIKSRRFLKITAKKNAETAAAKTAEEEEDDEKMMAEKTLERPPTVSVLSREQLLDFLDPLRERGRSSKAAIEQQEKSVELDDDSFEGKFVDLVELLPPVPAKGEFDVNKIKSSLYFFS